MNVNYSNFEELSSIVQLNGKGFMVIEYRHVEDYTGMALAILLRYDVEKSEYNLTLEWMCLGLDLYGDTLMESYEYRFAKLKDLTDYILKKYNIAVTEIPLVFKFDSQEFPNPIYNGSEKDIYELNWQRFRKDFKSGKFLDRNLRLLYSSLGK